MYQNTQCHDSEDGCSKFLWNIGNHVPQYTITQKIAAVSSYVTLVPMYQHRPTQCYNQIKCLIQTVVAICYRSAAVG